MTLSEKLRQADLTAFAMSRGLGVDPMKLPSREIWRAHYDRDFALPIEQRRSFLMLWTLDAAPIGFSSADKIVIGEQAFMHLHIFDSGRRQMSSEDRPAFLSFDDLRKAVRKLKLLLLERDTVVFHSHPNRPFVIVERHHIGITVVNVQLRLNRFREMNAAGL